MAELKHDNWVGTTYGNNWMHRWLIKTLRVIDVRILYAFSSVFVVPPTMIVQKKERKAIYKYFRERHGHSRIKSCWLTYLNHCAFAQVVIDKFAMYAGKRYKITIDGYEAFEELSKASDGFVQLSSHIGNYEIAGYSLVAKDKRLNALVFGGEKESVMKNREKMFGDKNIRMIAMQPDMSHVFLLNSALSDGEILSMPADRLFGSEKCFAIDFLGKEAHFPQGPFIMAAVRDVPMLFVAVMKSSAKSYHIVIRIIVKPTESNTKARALAMARDYVRNLECIVREYPKQWYNYFDFWS